MPLDVVDLEDAWYALERALVLLGEPDFEIQINRFPPRLTQYGFRDLSYEIRGGNCLGVGKTLTAAILDLTRLHALDLEEE